MIIHITTKDSWKEIQADGELTPDTFAFRGLPLANLPLMQKLKDTIAALESGNQEAEVEVSDLVMLEIDEQTAEATWQELPASLEFKFAIVATWSASEIESLGTYVFTMDPVPLGAVRELPVDAEEGD